MKREKSEHRKIFNSEGYIRDTQLKVMNLKPVSNQAAASSGGLQYSAHAKWEEVKMIQFISERQSFFWFFCFALCLIYVNNYGSRSKIRIFQKMKLSF